MAQTQFLWNVQVVAHWKYTACGTDALMGNDHCTIMERRILEENVFYQSLIDARVKPFASGHDVIEWGGTLNHDECTNLLLTHAQTRHHDGHDGLLQLFWVVLIAAVGEEATQRLYSLMGAHVIKKLPDVFLKQDDEGYHTY